VLGVDPGVRVADLAGRSGGQPQDDGVEDGSQDGRREAALVDIDDVARVAEALAGVHRTAPNGLAGWRYHGRLVARPLDDVHLVIRADFDYRDSILRQFPGTLSVPTRYLTHMMVVADLAGVTSVPSRRPSRQRGGFSAVPADGSVPSHRAAKLIMACRPSGNSRCTVDRGALDDGVAVGCRARTEKMRRR
jgi:hypothetical protein